MADDIVGLGSRNRRMASSDPTGEATTMRAAPAGAQRAHGGQIAEPGREPVVHDQDRASLHLGGREVIAETLHLASQLALLARENALQPARPEADARRQPAVDDRGPVFGQRPDRELAVARGSELAYHQHLQRCTQAPRHLGRDRDSAAGEAEHERTQVSGLEQLGGELAPGMGSVREEHHCVVHPRLPRHNRPMSHDLSLGSSGARGARHGEAQGRIEGGHQAPGADRRAAARGGLRAAQLRVRRLRFISPKPSLSPRELAYLVNVDGHNHEALGASDHASGQGVGVARFIRLTEEPEVAEVAVTVIDSWQRRGLGTLLLEHLADQARAQGITHFSALDLEREHGCARGAAPRRRGDRADRRRGGVVEYRTALGSAGIGRDLRDALRSAASGRLRLPQRLGLAARSAARVGPLGWSHVQKHQSSSTTSTRPANEEEVRDAALQYVRKISGSTKPSQANAEAFERAVQEVALATRRLLDGLVTNAPPKNRELEAERRRARAAQRFAA